MKLKSKIISYILIGQFISLGVSATDFSLQPNCYGNSTVDCYPFDYQNSNGTENEFCTFIAWLNYVAPFLNILAYKAGNYLTEKWNEGMFKDIDKKLEGITAAKLEIRDLLGQIVSSFNNGIGQERGDQALILATIESLNWIGCQECVAKFVDIVANSSKKSQKENREEFLNFVETVTKKKNGDNGVHKSTHGHEYIAIEKDAPNKKDFSGKAKAACCYKWTHPFHWTSCLYAAFATIIPPIASLLINKNNQSGSVIGDWANFSNAFCIPTNYAFTVWQNWKNLPRIRAQKLKEGIDDRLNSIHVIIEIASSAIGKMKNNIGKEQAKFILTALVLMGWPDDLVAGFETLAANIDNKTSEEEVNSFINDIQKRYQDMKISYDNPISYTENQGIEVSVEDDDSNKIEVDSKGKSKENNSSLVEDNTHKL